MNGRAGSCVDDELHPAEGRSGNWRSRLTYPGRGDICCSQDIRHIENRGILQMEIMLQRETFCGLTGKDVDGEESSRKGYG